MTCQQAIDVLADYLEATLDPDAGRELESHLAGCAACVAYLNTYRKTQELTRQAGQVEMPAEMKALLREYLLKQLGGPA